MSNQSKTGREERTPSEFPALIRATDLGEFLTDQDSEEVSDDVLLCCSDLDGPVQPDSSAMELMDEMARRYNVHAELLAALLAVMPQLEECDCIHSDRAEPLCPCRAARAAIAKAECRS